MNLPTQVTIEQAAQRIKGYVRVTPMTEFEAAGHDLTLKLEHLQYAGSFKARGATNKLLSVSLPESGVIAASGGNHGLAVAYAARTLKTRAEIFVPSITSSSKLNRLRSLGAEVTVTGDVYSEALAGAQARQTETQAMPVHAYDEVSVVDGQGTTFQEFERQVPKLDTVLVAVGGGGLIGGAAAWYRGRTKLVAVETTSTNAMSAALRAGKPTDVAVSGLAADALGATSVGEIPFTLAEEFVSQSVLVDDADVVDAMRQLWDDLRLVTEPAGAVALSAITSGAYVPEPDERVGVIVCGGNIDPEAFGSVIA